MFFSLETGICTTTITGKDQIADPDQSAPVTGYTMAPVTAITPSVVSCRLVGGVSYHFTALRYPCLTHLYFFSSPGIIILAIIKSYCYARVPILIGRNK